MKTNRVLTVALVLIAALSSNLLAQPGQGNGQGRHGDCQGECPKDGRGHGMGKGSGCGMKGRGDHFMGLMRPGVMLEIGMSMDQQAKVKARLEANETSRTQDHLQMVKLHDDLESALLSKDKSKIDAATTQLLNHKAKVQEAKIQDKAFFVSLLNSDQIKKLQEIQNQEKENRKNRMSEDGECPMRKKRKGK